MLVHVEHFASAADGGRHDRTTSQHRFDQHQRQALAVRGGDQHVSREKQLGDVFAKAKKLYAICDPQLAGKTCQRLTEGPFASDPQSPG